MKIEIQRLKDMDVCKDFVMQALVETIIKDGCLYDPQKLYTYMQQRLKNGEDIIPMVILQDDVPCGFFVLEVRTNDVGMEFALISVGWLKGRMSKYRHNAVLEKLECVSRDSGLGEIQLFTRRNAGAFSRVLSPRGWKVIGNPISVFKKELKQ
jgi:hypothetical protein